MDSAMANMFTDPQFITYFLVLGVSFLYCLRRARYLWQNICTICLMFVTWYYILRWTVNYKLQGGMNLFDDAYVDVVTDSQWKFTYQLLSWVVVASVWIHDENVCYLLFGMLGAMSAAFLAWVPLQQQSVRKIPLCYFVCAIASLYCILKLQITKNSIDEFGIWLKLLHLLLVLPKLMLYFNPNQIRIHGTFVYGAITTVIAWHHLADNHTYNIPITDCQLSITYDLLFCTLITFYFIINHMKNPSLFTVFALFFFAPIISPGALLGLYLSCIHAKDFHTQCVTYIQRTVAKYMRKKRDSTVSDSEILWMNLGEGWGVAGSTIDYNTACAKLAERLGKVVFQPGDGVLACGCGYGAEIVFWKDMFQLKHITGIDINEDAVNEFIPKHNLRLILCSAGDIKTKFYNKINKYDKIVALDSIYHYENKYQFFVNSSDLLPHSKCAIAVTDLMLKNTLQYSDIPYWLQIVLSAMNINVQYLWNQKEYVSQLRRAGWGNVHVESLQSAHVLDSWFPQIFLKYLDYVLVSANKQSNKQALEYDRNQANLKPKKNIAVVGSGLSGLTTAHLLSGEHNVTVMEANPKGGLSGRGIDVFGQTVDIPLRIIGKGYYTYVEELALSLDVKLSPIKKDYLSQFNYGNNCPLGENGSFSYSTSWYKNFIALLPHLKDMYSFNYQVHKPENEVETETETWGEWMTRHRYDTSRYSADKFDTKSQSQSLSGNAPKIDSFIIWMLMGQASWVLSCTYNQVLHYPASVILTFIRNLGGGASVTDTKLSGGETGRMLRIHPSMQALEYALTYGVEVMYSKRLSNISQDKVIDGKKYDYIVIATEASQVKQILDPSIFPPVFSRVKYHASKIIVHTDSSLMPKDKSDWKAFNVCQQKGHDMCMLTAWLNEYYQENTFTRDVFQTWNPHREPQGDIVSENHFLRVLHTSDTPNILKEIDDAQGANGVYYAGAYSVEGLGLLEQAARSGKKVANLIAQKEKEPKSESRASSTQ